MAEVSCAQTKAEAERIIGPLSRRSLLVPLGSLSTAVLTDHASPLGSYLDPMNVPRRLGAEAHIVSANPQRAATPDIRTSPFGYRIRFVHFPGQPPTRKRPTYLLERSPSETTTHETPN